MTTNATPTLYWHDYETFGADPARDRPVQFAGLRTDLDLNPLGDPLVIYTRPPRDYLPHPDACLITGITPQHAEAAGGSEADFMAAIHAELSAPGTCGIGYNSLRFDDEVTRYSLYRNLYDPYAREWQNECSRWDLIDVVRTAYALRPEGIEWPSRDDGLPSFRLEELTAANGLDHGKAHDALSDVEATIALARLLRERQPRLYEHLFSQRSKRAVAALIDVAGMKPLLHVSGMFGAARANLGLVVPLLWHPVNRNEVICYDLSVDPAPLLEQPADRLRELLYARADDLPAGESRPALKSVHINRCPVLLPAKMASPEIAARAGLDGAACRRHLSMLRDFRQSQPNALEDKLAQISERPPFPASDDPDLALYAGFVPDEDRQLLDALRQLSPAQLALAPAPFRDGRLPGLLFRYRARNFPDTLSREEQEEWEMQRFAMISEPDDPKRLDLTRFHELIEKRLAEPERSDRDQVILRDLQRWGDSLLL